MNSVLKMDSESLSTIDKMVMIVLILKCNKDWECWPSVQTIAKEASVSDRSVQRSLRDLEAKGLITVSFRRFDGSQNDTSVYTIPRANPPTRLLQESPHPGDTLSPPGDSDDKTLVTLCPVPGDTVSPRIVQGNSTKENIILSACGSEPTSPVKTRKVKSGKMVKPKTFMTEFWLPRPSYVEDEKLGRIDGERWDVIELVGEFRDYWLKRGEAMADWDAAFRTWVRNAKKFGTCPRYYPPPPPPPPPLPKRNVDVATTSMLERSLGPANPTNLDEALRLLGQAEAKKREMMG